MNHYGIAFGVITATVIGGSLVADHLMKDKTLPAPKAAASSTPAPSEASTQPSSTTQEANRAQ